MSLYDPLIFGKNQFEKVVGLEVVDHEDGSNIELFIQNEDGTVETKIEPNKYWLLSDKQVQRDWVRLKGDLHYKWGKQYTSRQDFQKFRAIFKKNNDITTVWNEKESAMIKDGISYFKGMHPKDVSLLSLDIETTGLDPLNEDAMVLCLSTTFRFKDVTIKKFYAYDEYPSPKELIEAMNSHVQLYNPALIIGHNLIAFDLPYLAQIAQDNGTSLNWGRDGSEIKFSSRESNFRLDGTRDLHYHEASIFGREIVDTYFLAIKYDVARAMESYGLKSLIAQLGLETPGRTFYDASQIRFKYKDPEEFRKIKEYCKDDADDAIKLWDLMGSLFFYTSQMVPKSFSKVLLTASGSQINSMMMRAYLQQGHSLPKASETNKFEGALSWGRAGIYDNVAKFDCAAMYPSIIIAHEVYDKEKDPNAYLLTLVKEFKKNRLEYKRLAAETGLQHYKDMDTAAKGILNSFYGFYGATGLSFNSPKCAEFITAKGREILRTAITWATGKQFEEIAPEYFTEENTDDTEET